MSTGRLLPRVLVAACVAALIGGLGIPAAAQDSPDFDQEYLAQEGLEMIKAAQAYAQGYTGKGVVVAVFDSGVDGSHSEFVGQLLEAYYIDEDVVVDPEDSEDLRYHGTHVAGILAARRDGRGMHGVAYDAKIVAVREGANTSDVDADTAAGFLYLVENPVPIVNNSWGLSPFKPITQWTRAEAEARYPKTIAAIHELARMGTLFVWAAGNDKLEHGDLTPGLPYLYPELRNNWLTVVAVGWDKNTLAEYSNKCGVTKHWCLAAPGGNTPDNDDDEAEAGPDESDGQWPPPPPEEDKLGIYSAMAHYNKYIRFDGTSMAAPMVAGGAALVKQAFPYFSARHIQQTLLTTAEDIGEPGVDDVFGWGLLDVGKAVRGPARFVYDFDVDTQGYDSTFANDIDGDGRLIKRGEGTLALAGSNSYTGGTHIYGGTVHMNEFHVGNELVIMLHEGDGPIPLTTGDAVDLTAVPLALRLGTLPQPGDQFTVLEAAGGLRGHVQPGALQRVRRR